MALGDIITAPIANARFDGGFDGMWPAILHIDGNVFALFFFNGVASGNLNVLRTVRINNDGTFAFINQVPTIGGEHFYNQIIHVYGDIYAVLNVDMPPGVPNGYLHIFSISAAGALNYLGNHIFTATCGNSPMKIVELSPNYFAIFYRRDGVLDGRIQTVRISNDGLTRTNILNAQFAAEAGSIDGIHIANDIYAIVYHIWTGGDFGRLRTVRISNNGATITPINVLTFDTAFSNMHICHVDGNVYAISYSGPGNDGWMATVSISDDGVTLANIANLEFEGNICTRNALIHIGGDMFAVFYRGGPGVNDGWLRTIRISADGATIALYDNSNWQPGVCDQQNVARLPNTNIYGLPHIEGANDGWLATFEIDSAYPPIVRTDPATEIT